jgi:hypothetical protein
MLLQLHEEALQDNSNIAPAQSVKNITVIFNNVTVAAAGCMSFVLCGFYTQLKNTRHENQ